MPRTTPTSSPATTTPQKLPSPPITTTTKVAVRISVPIAGCTPASGADITPASPASPTPSANTAVSAGFRLMPSARTISGSRVPARTIIPNEVLLSSSQQPITAAADTASTVSR